MKRKRLLTLIMAVCMVISVFPAMMASAEELATAMECRCYRGDKNRTKLVKLSFRVKDLVFFLLSASVLAGVIVLRYVDGWLPTEISDMLIFDIMLYSI